MVELRVREFVNKSFKCEVSVFYSPSPLLDMILTGFQSQILWASLSGAGLGWDDLLWTPCFSVSITMDVIPLLLVYHLTGSVDLD